MYQNISLKNNNDYFTPLSKRDSKGVYFYRYIGYEDETLVFLKKYQESAEKRGIYFKESIQNPTDEEVKHCLNIIDGNFQLNMNYITKNNTFLIKKIGISQTNLLNEAIFEVLNNLNKKGINMSILKNTYMKFICWSSRFQVLLTYLCKDEVPKVLYEGEISKYEVYMLQILSLVGCDVVYVNFNNEDSFIKYDNISKVIYGTKRGEPKKHFSKLDLNRVKVEETIDKELKKVTDKLVTNSWIKDDEDFFEVLEKGNNLRGCLLDPSKVYNLFIQYVGVDDPGLYNNRLLALKKSLEKENKPFVIIDKKIENPVMDEIPKINRTEFIDKESLTEIFLAHIVDNFSNTISSYIMKAFKEIVNELGDNNLNKIYNFCVKTYCWLNRYKNILVYNSNVIPLVVYYGECTVNEGYFLRALSKMPVDVIHISPKKPVNNLGGRIIELPNSMDIPQYPYKEARVKIATNAYQAEREIQSVIYTDTGMYRNQQFKKSIPVTIRTTYEEISILWNEEVKFRPFFKSEDEVVYLPNIFAKVCGVKDKQVNSYIKEIKALVNEDTIYFDSMPLLRKDIKVSDNSIRQVLTGNTIDKEKIKNIPEYKYDYINIDMQNYIIEKIQELLELNWLKYDERDLYVKIIGTILDLDKVTLNLIQKFDFTKKNPKVVIVDTDEKMTDFIDCVYILFLNLIGFDIIIFTPTGYRNIEKYINEETFENYIIGDFVFDVKAPKIKANQIVKNNNFFERLFR